MEPRLQDFKPRFPGSTVTPVERSERGGGKHISCPVELVLVVKKVSPRAPPRQADRLRTEYGRCFIDGSILTEAADVRNGVHQQGATRVIHLLRRLLKAK